MIQLTFLQFSLFYDETIYITIYDHIFNPHHHFPIRFIQIFTNPYSDPLISVENRAPDVLEYFYDSLLLNICIHIGTCLCCIKNS